MANKIVLKKSSVTTKVPLTTDLDYGEVALNYADGKLYYKKSDGTTVDSFNAGADVTLTGVQTLTNKTLGSGSVLGADVTGGDFAVTRAMFKDTGWDYHDSGTTNALDYTNGSVQRWAPTASSNPTLSITNWPPTGNLGELLVEAVNLAAAGTVVYPTANWIKSDGTFAASPSLAGVTFTSGTDFILFWTRDAGTTIYSKVVR
jgi:hypothetical protein